MPECPKESVLPGTLLSVLIRLRKGLAGILRQALHFIILLLAQQCGIRRCVVSFHHVDCKSIILIRIAQAVRDIRLSLTVTTDIFYIKVQNVIVLLQQRLVGGTQEVIRSIINT